MIKNEFSKEYAFFNRRNIPQERGYTIIETMIAISLFLIIIMSGLGALLNANVLHKKSQDMRSIIDSLNFVMEDMSKNIRTGSNYHCFNLDDTIPTSPPADIASPKSCENGDGWGIAFDYQYGSKISFSDQWVYYINDGKIFKTTGAPYVESNFIQMTPDEIVIDPNSSFAIVGAEPPPGNEQQPVVTIRLSGEITFKNVTTPFSLQTSISQRAVDI